MKIKPKKTKKYLNNFDFVSLFIEEIGWNYTDNVPFLPLLINDAEYNLEPIAQKCGMIVYHCQSQTMPNHSTRRRIDKEITNYTREHLIIYTDSSQQQQIWQWVRREKNKPIASREHHYQKNQPGDSLIQKLNIIAVSLDEEESLTLPEVTSRTRKALDVDKITKKFYDRFKKEHENFLKFIESKTLIDKEWYASLMLNRLMFIYFIQKKGFLDGNDDYLRYHLVKCQKNNSKHKSQSFYRSFLLKLCHEGLGKPEHNQIEQLLGKVPYLNGGLFEIHPLEILNTDIHIPDEAFDKIFNFFDEYQWHLDDRPLKKDNEINPDVLGYIFEKYTNQKQMGAYYTKEDITEYISKNCIIPFIFESVENYLCNPSSKQTV